MGLKETGAILGKKFITELGLGYKHDVVLLAVNDFCKQFTPGSLKQLIIQGKPPPDSTPLIEFLMQHRELVKEYSAKSLTKRFTKLMCKARPDLEETLYSLGEASGAWLYRCAEMIRDRVLNPARFMESIGESEVASVVCAKCGKAIIVPKDDIESLKQCPFCDAGREE